MIHSIDVLRVLEAFKSLKASSDIPEATKKLIAAELLPLVPPEIMAPNAKATCEYVRNTLREYISDGTTDRKAEKARSDAKEGSPSQETVSPEGAEVGRTTKPPEAAMGRPGVESQEARSDEKRQARKASRRP